jgi:pyrroloquinoline quinone biosynthesis protein D
LTPPAGALRLTKRVRLKSDAVRGTVVLLAPEAVIELNAEGVEVLSLCDGTRTEEEISEEMQRRYGQSDVATDIRAFLERVRARGWVERVT